MHLLVLLRFDGIEGGGQSVVEVSGVTLVLGDAAPSTAELAELSLEKEWGSFSVLSGKSGWKCMEAGEPRVREEVGLPGEPIPKPAD